MGENAIGYLLHRAGYHGHNVPHGCRAAFSTIMNEWDERDGKPHDRKVIDLMLAHASKDKIECAYNRAAYLPRRRELAQAWANMLSEGLPDPTAFAEHPAKAVAQHSNVNTSLCRERTSGPPLVDRQLRQIVSASASSCAIRWSFLRISLRAGWLSSAPVRRDARATLSSTSAISSTAKERCRERTLGRLPWTRWSRTDPVVHPVPEDHRVEINIRAWEVSVPPRLLRFI
jgi:hypothetical protein